MSRPQAWLPANREAIAAYSRHVDERGVFCDGVCRF
ncbi:type II toxin-antitoxin system CcdA family antitoxin [Pseudomonas tohonis]|nr:type II toxin-antitoxin system CcdA family antitoxin [Pseudomonas tohonis]